MLKTYIGKQNEKTNSNKCFWKNHNATCRIKLQSPSSSPYKNKFKMGQSSQYKMKTFKVVEEAMRKTF